MIEGRLKKWALYLKEERERLKLSQAFLGRRLRYSTGQFVSNCERGLCHPPEYWAPILIQCGYRKHYVKAIFNAVLKEKLIMKERNRRRMQLHAYTKLIPSAINRHKKKRKSL